MRGAITPFPQYAFMVWCSVKEKQGQPYLYCLLRVGTCISVCAQFSILQISLALKFVHAARDLQIVAKLILEQLKSLRTRNCFSICFVKYLP
jgi:hypothetical protein